MEKEKRRPPRETQHSLTAALWMACSIECNQMVVLGGFEMEETMKAKMRKRMHDLRDTNNLKQKDMGAILHRSQRVYSNYENGSVAVPLDIAVDLADYYGVSMDYLVGRSDDSQTEIYRRRRRKRP